MPKNVVGIFLEDGENFTLYSQCLLRWNNVMWYKQTKKLFEKLKQLYICYTELVWNSNSTTV